MPKLLDRWLIKELASLFFLFLFGFYCLFSLLDYSTHVQEFLKISDLPLLKIALYYLCLLVKQFHILFSLAFLIAIVKVLTSINIHQEMTALRSAGIALRRILLPFFCFALFISALSLANFELALPQAERFIDTFQRQYLKPQTKKNKKKAKLKTYLLEDETKLIAYSNGSDLVDDVFWIVSQDEVWHFKTVDMIKTLGYLGDQMKRDKNGQLRKISSQPQIPLPPISHAKSRFTQSVESTSLTALYEKIQKGDYLNCDYKNSLQTQFYYKVTTPFIPILLLTALAPFCLVHRRHHRLFFLYAMAIFGFIALFTLMDSLVIAGENGLISPLAAMTFFPIALQLLFSWRLKYAN